jgi:pSer/pThr/pTyr-binding forkhead associated (FHA) protein
MSPGTPLLLAKIVWRDPLTDTVQEFALAEGATASIGRLDTSDIFIREQHVSRQHAVIQYRDGLFLITDLGSANGVFVNGQPVREPFPLVNGDEIRLYVPVLRFLALATDEDARYATRHSTVITAISSTGAGRLLVTSGPQEGSQIRLLRSTLTVGRATRTADWEICLEDPSVSRPHARLQCVESVWILYDLGSANGTFVNGTPVNEKGRALRDGDVITFGSTVTLFREG